MPGILGGEGNKGKTLRVSASGTAWEFFGPGTVGQLIRYDADGMPQAIAVTTGDIADSADKRYCTDAQKVVIGNTSGVNSGNQDLSGLVPKTTKVAGKALSGDITLSASDVGADPAGEAAAITLAGLGGVPTSRSLSINGTALDLSDDRSWTVSGSLPDLIYSKLAPASNETIIAGCGAYVPDAYEIVNTYYMEIADTAILEIG